MSQISQSDALTDDDDGDLPAASGVVYIFNFEHSCLFPFADDVIYAAFC